MTTRSDSKARAAVCAGWLAATLFSTGAAMAAPPQVVRFLQNETDPPSIAFYNQAIAEFEKENPGIKVEMESVSTDSRLQKVTAALRARTMPEVFKLLSEERVISPARVTWFPWTASSTRSARRTSSMAPSIGSTARSTTSRTR